jgi:hypothetical protein
MNQTLDEMQSGDVVFFNQCECPILWHIASKTDKEVFLCRLDTGEKMHVSKNDVAMALPWDALLVW